MSRTYRKRAITFRQYFSLWQFNKDGSLTSNYGVTYPKEWVIKAIYDYKCKTSKHYTHNLPRVFRNMVNRSRRTKDRQELWKELNHTGYEGLYSKWNSKDSNSWGYW